MLDQRIAPTRSIPDEEIFSSIRTDILLEISPPNQFRTTKHRLLPSNQTCKEILTSLIVPDSQHGQRQGKEHGQG